jgi:ppGpp synthetase/RelA/SpoT-type nucleotidyltranferase
MYEPRQLERLSKKLDDQIEDIMERVGIFHRIFYRVKTASSVTSKMERKSYNGTDSFLRDLIGIRVILYFPDDIEHVRDQLKKLFHLVEETIDRKEETNFEPSRINLIFRIPDGLTKEFRDHITDGRIDNTFEVQLRTILSEGWHEVEHDVRYKCKEDWENHKDIARIFNGILATLETSEWAILSLLNQISYRHYKANNAEALILTKFRLRFSHAKLSEPVKAVISEDILKQIIKIDRQEVLDYIYTSGIILPLTMDNFIFIINYMTLKKKDIQDLMPILVTNELGKA